MMGAHGAGQTLGLFLPRCAVLVEMFGFGGGGPRPGAYAGTHSPYMAWEDERCPPDLSCWNQPGCRDQTKCRANDNQSGNRDMHLNITRFVEFVGQAVATRQSCLDGSGKPPKKAKSLLSPQGHLAGEDGSSARSSISSKQRSASARSSISSEQLSEVPITALLRAIWLKTKQLF